jgi:NADP-dependent 3-hydroxy acid dehydrogenase YdfG
MAGPDYQKTATRDERWPAGRVAVVTGASSGIGEATAVALAGAGAHVVVAGRRLDRITAVAHGITSRGGSALAVATDVAQEDQVRDLVARTTEAFGGLDILINNAGVMSIGPVADARTEDWRKMIGVNLLGVLYCTHAALPLIAKRGRGDIVNVSSAGGRRTSAGRGVYSMTKFGIGAFSEALRQEALESNIRVTLIEPGFVDTELAITSDNPFMAAAAAAGKKRIGEVLQSSDVANAIMFALSQPAYVSINEILMRPTRQLT